MVRQEGYPECPETKSQFMGPRSRPVVTRSNRAPVVELEVRNAFGAGLTTVEIRLRATSRSRK